MVYLNGKYLTGGDCNRRNRQILETLRLHPDGNRSVLEHGDEPMPRRLRA